MTSAILIACVPSRILSLTAPVGLQNWGYQMLMAIDRSHSDEYGTVEHRIYKSGRGFSYEFSYGDQLEITRMSKRRLLDENYGRIEPWLFLDDQIIAVRRYDLDGLPGVSCLYKTDDGYVLRVWHQSVLEYDDYLTFSEAVRWLNEKPEQLERIAHS